MASYPFLMLVVVGALAAIGMMFLGWHIGTFLGVLQREATTNGKRIEFAGALIALLALVASVGGLAYSIAKVDALEDRVLSLERSLEALKLKP